MPHFTFIAFFDGSDYISQHEAKDLLSACVMWKNHLVQDQPFGDSLDVKEFAKSFDFYIQALPPVPKGGVVNVWDFGFNAVRKKSIDAYIILSDKKKTIANVPRKSLSEAVKRAGDSM
jgi:hypothetical protein